MLARRLRRASPLAHSRRAPSVPTSPGHQGGGHDHHPDEGPLNAIGPMWVCQISPAVWMRDPTKATGMASPVSERLR